VADSLEPRPAALAPFDGAQLPGSHRRQFRVAYVLLALVLGGAVGALVVGLQQKSKPAPPSWSSWRPTTSDPAAGSRQIADYVAQQYQLPTGEQLVGVVTNPYQSQNVQAIAVRTDKILIVDPKHTQMYALCGLGNSCAIAGGNATHARFELLRREALELALYTFKYLEGVDAAVVFFPPPPHGAQPSIFFRRSDFVRLLERPLVATLPTKTRLVPGRLTNAEEELVDRLTSPWLFRFNFERLPNGTPVLVLQPGF
jgi:hypothetical protein